jgi:uncharacterized phage protein gp47/JayE
MLSRARRITPALVDTEGSDANLFVGSTAFMAAAVARQCGDRVAALLLESAQKEDLDRYAWDRYQELRKGASPALGLTRLFRPTAAAGAGSISVGTKLLTLGGIEYVTTTQADFGLAQTDNAAADVRAVQAGKAFQVGANQIRRFDNPGALFDKTIQVTNDVATAGGEDREDDPTFRARVRAFWLTARRGVLSAIEAGARAVPGVVSAMASEALTSGGQPARVVTLAIADSSGVANAALAARVSTSLLDYRAAGIAVVIATSIPDLVTVKLKLQFNSGVNTSAVTVAVRAALFEFVNSLPVNGTLYRADVYSVLRRFVSQGLRVPEDTVVEPTGDVVPGPGRTLRTRLSDITVV